MLLVHVIEHALLAKAWVIATLESLYRDYPVQVAFAVTAVCVLFLVAFARCLSRASRRSSLAQRAAKKRKERDSVVHGDAVRVRQTIERLGITPAQREEIVSLSVCDLLEKMAQNLYTSEQITAVYCERVLAIGLPVLNAVSEVNFIEALDMARESDARRARGELPRLLEGIPVSIKDQIDQRGFDSTCGNSSFTGQPKEEDSVVVKLLRDEGAIPFVRSTTMQCLMLPETASNLWGITHNPWNLQHTPGGSSGGEGALVAGRCSPLGIGTDIGGSVRIPSSFCGLVGLQSTALRLSLKGVSLARRAPFATDEGVPFSGNDHVVPTVGPIARTAQDCALAFRVLAASRAFALDPALPPLPLQPRTVPTRGPLRIAYVDDDGFFQPCAAVQRAMRDTIAALKKQGHHVQPLQLDHAILREAPLQYIAQMSADGNLSAILSGLEGEEPHSYYRTLISIANAPRWIARIAAGVYSLLGHRRVAAIGAAAGGKSAKELWMWAGKRSVARKRILDAFLRQKWSDGKTAPLDALLYPATGIAAFAHGSSADAQMAVSYTFVWNNFNIPAGVLPVTTVRESEQHYRSDMRDGTDYIARAAHRSMQTAKGLPVGIQLVGQPFREEALLDVMELVERALTLEGHGVGLPADPTCGPAEGNQPTRPSPVKEVHTVRLRATSAHRRVRSADRWNEPYMPGSPARTPVRQRSGRQLDESDSESSGGEN